MCHAPSAAALKGAFGAGLATNSFDDIEIAKTILVCGANATEDHPIVGARIKQAALRGARLVVIDPRRIELAEYANVHLTPKPGTNVALLNAMARTILVEGLADRAFIADRVSGLSFLPASSDFHRGHNAAEILASSRAAAIIDRLKAEFEVLVFDAPPLLPVVDARVVAGYADQIALVMLWKRTPKALVRRAMKALGRDAGKIVGVVVNEVDPREDAASFSYGGDGLLARRAA